MVNESKIDIIKKGKPIRIMDFFVILFFLIVSVFLIYFGVYQKKGNYLEVSYKNNQSYYTLTKDQVFEIDGHLTVRIKNGYAFVIKADCNNKDCRDYGGKIKYEGQKIVCLPNKIVLRIVSKTSDPDPGWVST